MKHDISFVSVIIVKVRTVYSHKSGWFLIALPKYRVLILFILRPLNMSIWCKQQCSIESPHKAILFFNCKKFRSLFNEKNVDYSILIKTWRSKNTKEFTRRCALKSDVTNYESNLSNCVRIYLSEELDRVISIQHMCQNGWC
jgi:hypothetical protein